MLWTSYRYLALTILFFGTLGEAEAQSLIPPNECALIVASRRTVLEARAYAAGISDKRYVKIFQSSNGWYAISIGTLKPHEIEPIMTKWKASGKIPKDSLCSNGRKYVAEISLSTGRTVAKSTGRTVATASSAGSSGGYEDGSTCGNPMTVSQSSQTLNYLNDLFAPKVSVSLDKCRNLALSYGGARRTGKLHTLSVDLNPSWHGTTYFGLPDQYNSIHTTDWNYVTDTKKTKKQSADWLVTYNNHIQRILTLSGYTVDPLEDRRRKNMTYFGRVLDRGDLGDLIAGFAALAKAGGAIVGTYSCSLNCERYGNDAKTSISLSGVNATQAYDHTFLNGTKICSATFGSGWSNPSFFSGIDCVLQ